MEEGKDDMNVLESTSNKLKVFRLSFIKSLKFKPNAGFFELKVVWLTIALILAASVALMAIIYFDSEMPKGCFNYECVNNFLTIFKVPIGITALLIPILAVYATNHRSIQSKAAAEIAQAQNTFVNYYKHLDEFEKYGHKLEINKYFIDFRRLHKKMYPKAEEGIFSISSYGPPNPLPRCIYEARLFASEDDSTFFQAEENIISILKEFLSDHHEYLTHEGELIEGAEPMLHFGGDRSQLRTLKEALRLAEIFHHIWCFDTKYDRGLLKNIRVLKKVLSWHKGQWGDKEKKPIHLAETLIQNGYTFKNEHEKQRATGEIK